MRKIALSAIIAIVATVSVFRAVLMAGGDITTAFAAAVVAFAVATFAAIAAFTFTFAVAAAFTFAAVAAFTFAAVAAFTFTFAAVVVAFTFAAVVVAFAATAVAATELKIPYRWVFGVYAMGVATLSGVFLFSGLATSVAITIVGCGLIAGISRLYNYNCQPALASPKQ